MVLAVQIGIFAGIWFYQPPTNVELDEASLVAKLLHKAVIDKKITRDDSLVPVPQWCQQLSDEIGVPIKVNRTAQDLKLDIFVKDLPIADLMDGVAKTLNCEWQSSGGGLELTMSVAAVNQFRNMTLAEAQDRKAEFIKKTEDQIWLAGTVPAGKTNENFFQDPELKAIWDRLIEERKAIYATGDVKKIELCERRYGAFVNVSWGVSDLTFGRILSQFSEANWKQFWQGEPFVVSTLKDVEPLGQKVFKIDRKSVKQMSQVSVGSKVIEFDTVVAIRWNNEKSEIQAKGVHIPEPNEFYKSPSGVNFSPGRFSSTGFDLGENAKKQKLFLESKSWRDTSKFESLFPQEILFKTPSWKSPWANGRRRLGEHLRWLHLASGIPIIAEANRSPLYYWNRLERSYPKVSNYLKALVDDFDTHVVPFRKGVLVRSRAYWQFRRYEAPESFWNQWEKEGQKSLADLLRMSTLVRKDQLRNSHIAYPLTRVLADELASGLEGLQFLASLSVREREQAFGAGLNVQQLNSEQQRRLKLWAVEMLFDCGNINASMAKLLSKYGFLAFTAALPSRLKISQTPTEFSRYTEAVKDRTTQVDKDGFQIEEEIVKPQNIASKGVSVQMSLEFGGPWTSEFSNQEMPNLSQTFGIC